MSKGFWRRLLHGVSRIQHRPDWPAFVGENWPDRIMDVDVTDDFHKKQGRTTGRWILHDDERRLAVYLKRHYRLPRWHGLMATLWPGTGWSPALQEARHLDWAQRNGFPVPAVVAAGETIGPWGRLQSFLAVEELTDMLPLHRAIPAAAKQMAPKAFSQWKCNLLTEMARLTRELHLQRCFHQDLYLCHFYVYRSTLEVAPADWVGQVYVIDLHRLARHPLMWRLWQVKDLGQLLYSSEIAGITLRDRIRFLRSYLGHSTELNAFWLRHAVLFKWRRYRNHNARTRRRKLAKQQSVGGPSPVHGGEIKR